MRFEWVLVALAMLAGSERARGQPPGEPLPSPTSALAQPVAAPAPQPGAAADRSWLGGAYLTGQWGGSRSALLDRGIALEALYASDTFTAHGQVTLLAHAVAGLTLDSEKLGLWDGGKLYAMVQSNQGHSINNTVWSADGVTNLEAGPYKELAELFIEQAALDDRLRVRIGKQDANRDFGTPRLTGDFLNNSFGMYPTAPLPSYPMTGLGAIAVARPVAWLDAKLAVYEGRPMVGGIGLANAFHGGGGYTVVAGAAATHQRGAGRDGGTTSAGLWRQSGRFMQVDGAPVAEPRRFAHDMGWFVQHEERFYLHPDDPGDPRGLALIARASWAQPDRTAITRYAGASAAWHGIGSRRGDAVGIGGGYLRVTQPLGGTRGPRDEWFAELFYALRLTRFVSLQPDFQAFRHPGGDHESALVAGLRLKLAL
jgi:porin